MKRKMRIGLLGICLVMLCSTGCNVINIQPTSSESSVIPDSSTSTKDENEEKIHEIYLKAAQSGYKGTYEEWLASIKGEKGDDGKDGEDGETPYIGSNGDWWIGKVDTGVAAHGTAGVQGEKGDTGATGMSSYEIYLKYHPEYFGNEEEWVNDVAEGKLVNKLIVDFDTDGGSAIDSIETTYRSKISKPSEVPVKNGYSFLEWTYQSQTFDFASTVLTESITLVASYEKVPVKSYAEITPAASTCITDVLGGSLQLPFISQIQSIDHVYTAADDSFGSFDLFISTDKNGAENFIQQKIGNGSIYSSSFGVFKYNSGFIGYQNGYYGTPYADAYHYYFTKSSNSTFFCLCSYVLSDGSYLKLYFGKYTDSSDLPMLCPHLKETNAPVVNIDDNGLARWNSLNDSYGHTLTTYCYSINGGEEVLTNNTSVSLEVGDSIVVKGLGDGITSPAENPYSLPLTYHTNLSSFSEEELLKYQDNYYYSTLVNDSERNFYNRINTQVKTFYTDGNDALYNSGFDMFYIGDDIPFTGLTFERAKQIYFYYKYDNPLYYFLSNSYIYYTSSFLVCVDSNYAYGQDRKRTESRLYDAIASYQAVDEIANSSTDAQKVKNIHDLLLQNITYGSDSSASYDAHSVIGLFLDGLGVCETYARSFAFLLQINGIEAMYVGGYSREETATHAWNIAQIDDDYYYFDVTWDDSYDESGYYSYQNGIEMKYCYFAKGTSTYLANSTGETFEDCHTPDSDAVLPKVSTTDYSMTI